MRRSRSRLAQLRLSLRECVGVGSGVYTLGDVKEEGKVVESLFGPSEWRTVQVDIESKKDGGGTTGGGEAVFGSLLSQSDLASLTVPYLRVLCHMARSSAGSHGSSPSCTSQNSSDFIIMGDTEVPSQNVWKVPEGAHNRPEYMLPPGPASDAERGCELGRRNGVNKSLGILSGTAWLEGLMRRVPAQIWNRVDSLLSDQQQDFMTGSHPAGSSGIGSGRAESSSLLSTSLVEDILEFDDESQENVMIVNGAAANL